MKKILILLLCVFSFTIQAQEKTKRIEIYKASTGEYVNAIQTIVDNKPTNTDISFFGRDHQYQMIDEYITFYYGSPKEFIVLLNQLIKSFDEEPDITITIDDLQVTIVKMMGKKTISLRKKNESGFRYFNLKSLEKIKEKTENWCKENNVSFN